MCVHTHIHISMSGVDSRCILRHQVLSDTPTECVTQCANVTSLKQNTRHYANHALEGYMHETKCDTTYTLGPLYHIPTNLKAARGVSSLKTSSSEKAVHTKDTIPNTWCFFLDETSK